MPGPNGSRSASLGDPDDTVRLKSRPGPVARRGIPGLIVVAIVVAVATFAGAGIGAWYALRSPVFPLASEAAIFNHVSTSFAFFRFRDDPRILVVDCPDLRSQGMMFDRIAALVEKADTPRNRVLTEAQFGKVLVAAHQSMATYYYGNDYPAAALRKFFDLAAAEKIGLTPQEKLLEHVTRQEGFLRPHGNGAVISLPQAGTGHRVGWKARAVILRHELAHGAYFTIPSYRRFVHRFYNTQMTPAQQADFRNFLIRDGYDPHDRDLIVNETIAYMIFTRDPEFFNAHAVGMTDAELASLRTRFEAAMPHFWLRPLATAPLPIHR